MNHFDLWLWWIWRDGGGGGELEQYVGPPLIPTGRSFCRCPYIWLLNHLTGRYLSQVFSYLSLGSERSLQVDLSLLVQGPFKTRIYRHLTVCYVFDISTWPVFIY